MVFAKRKGYRVERKIRKILEKHGWKVVRAGGSLGEADLVCIKGGRCLLFQVKSKKSKTLYYNGYMKNKFEGFPFFLIVDFGYGNIRVVRPKKVIRADDGIELEIFLKRR
jgi:Holliday junction resolvase